MLFEGMSCSPQSISVKIFSSLDMMKMKQKPLCDASKRLKPFEINYPAGFFDGASQNQVCGCRAWLMISPDCHYKIFWNGGRGTNMRAKLIALWVLLWFTNQLYLEELWVFGDAKVIINHLNRGK